MPDLWLSQTWNSMVQHLQNLTGSPCNMFYHFIVHQDFTLFKKKLSMTRFNIKTSSPTVYPNVPSISPPSIASHRHGFLDQVRLGPWDVL